MVSLFMAGGDISGPLAGLHLQIFDVSVVARIAVAATKGSADEFRPSPSFAQSFSDHRHDDRGGPVSDFPGWQEWRPAAGKPHHFRGHGSLSASDIFQRRRRAGRDQETPRHFRRLDRKASGRRDAGSTFYGSYRRIFLD